MVFRLRCLSPIDVCISALYRHYTSCYSGLYFSLALTGRLDGVETRYPGRRGVPLALGYDVSALQAGLCPCGTILLSLAYARALIRNLKIAALST